MATLKDLARQLASIHKMKLQDADVFINAFVETILEGLEKDNQVKIKGFGTFKLTSVRDRESINVNTGERVLISGHSKISFTPDVQMRDAVNKPFLHFDTVILNDGVDFEDIDSSSFDNGDSADEEGGMQEIIAEKSSDAVRVVTGEDEVEEIVAEEKDKEENAVVVETLETEVVAAEEEFAVEEPQKSSVAEVEPMVDAAAESLTEVDDSVMENTVSDEPEQNNADDDVTDADVIVDNDLEANNVETNVVESNDVEPNNGEANDTDDAKVNDESDDYDDGQSESSCKKVFILYAVIINILLVMIAFTAGYYCARFSVFDKDESAAVENKTSVQSQVKPNKTSKVSESHAEKKETSLKADSVTKGNTSTKEVTVSKNDSGTKKDAVTKGKSSEKTVKESKPVEDNSSKYNKDPRVRTGAYVIEGVAETVVVREGQSLKSISRFYLGPDMECYVEAINGKTEFKTGDKVLIPKLRLKKRKL